VSSIFLSDVCSATEIHFGIRRFTFAAT